MSPSQVVNQNTNLLKTNFKPGRAVIIGIVGVVAVVVLIGALGSSNSKDQNSAAGQSSQTISVSSAGSTANSIPSSGESVADISNETGISQDQISGAMSVAARYQLDTYDVSVIAKDAAELYSMESSGKYSAVLQQSGMGSLDSITDTLSHLIKSWSVQDSEVSHTLDAIFNGLIKSTFTWSDYTNALIANGPKMSGYASLADASIEFAALQSNVSTTDAAITMFNTVGDALANPNSKLNLSLGGPGYIRTVVKNGGSNGIIDAMEKISQAVNKATSSNQ